jgi:hypothetical protein
LTDVCTCSGFTAILFRESIWADRGGALTATRIPEIPTGAIQIIMLVACIVTTNKIKMRFPIVAAMTLFPISGAIGLIMVPRTQPKSLLGCYYVALVLGVLQPLMYS